MPVPEREQDTGTVRLIWSVTEGSVAETRLEINMMPKNNRSDIWIPATNVALSLIHTPVIYYYNNTISDVNIQYCLE